MNMKVHQTLVWLNLLSFRTKDLAEPTIGIQSAAANQTHCSVILTLSHKRTHCTVLAVTAISRTGPAGSEEILSSVARWQKFRPKSSKGAAEEKKFVAEFWLILPKTGRKGAAENFQKSSLFLAVTKLNLIFNIQGIVKLMFLEICRAFSQIGRTF